MKIEFDRYFIDTNVFIYHTIEKFCFFNQADSVIQQIISGGLEGFISIQVINEYFSISTNPKNIEKPFSVNDACENIESYCSFLSVLPNTDRYLEILRVCRTHKIKHKQIFDLNIYLTMKQNGLLKIITANEDDFKMFKDIEIINPFK